jgi:predicted enzyme related to lactoylglutathione lyase
MTAGITKGLSHISVNVSDMAKAKEFYRAVFGWKELFSMEMSGPDFEAAVGVPGAAGEVAGGEVGDNRLELVWLSFVNTPSTPGLGLSKIVFEVDDADEAWQHAVRLGVTVSVELHEIAGCRVVTINDPDDLRIDLIEYLPGGGAWGGHLGRTELHR